MRLSVHYAVLIPLMLFYVLIGFAFTDDSIFSQFQSLRTPAMVAAILIYRHQILSNLTDPKKFGIICPVLLLSLYIIVNISLSSGLDSRADIRYWINNAIIYLVTVAFLMNAPRKPIVIFLTSQAVVYSVLALSYASNHIPLLRSLPLPTLIGSEHQLAGQAALYCIPITLVLFELAHKPKQKLLLSIFVLASFTGVMFSAARAPTVGYVFILLLWRKSRKHVLFVTVLAMVMGIALWSLGSTERLEERYTRVFFAAERGTPRAASEVDFRLTHLEYSARMFRNHPIFGAGYGSWNENRGAIVGVRAEKFALHNGWALILSELGVVGLILLAYSWFRSCTGAPWARKYMDAGAMHRGGFLGLLGIGIVSFFGDTLIDRDALFFLSLAAGGKLRTYYARLGRTSSL